MYGAIKYLQRSFNEVYEVVVAFMLTEYVLKKNWVGLPELLHSALTSPSMHKKLANF